MAKNQTYIYLTTIYDIVYKFNYFTFKGDIYRTSQLMENFP